MKGKRAILLVSFGSSYKETREKTLEPIGAQVREAYPQYPVYRAWTSRIIRKKMLERDGEDIPDVAQALEQMRADGISEVTVQPTILLKAIEYEGILTDLKAQREFFTTIRVGEPLLSSVSDGERIVRILAENLPLGEQDCLVLVGHGTEHPANAIYGSLNRSLRDKGISNIHIGTIEAAPTCEDVLEEVRRSGSRRIVLTPLLMVAGEHAHNDLDGADADSWKSRFLAAGFEVDCVVKGLGEYPGVRQIVLEHLKKAVSGSDGEGSFTEICR
ncbi:MAG: sirohydrochlorin cobaltochelatase [Lachnospiraceae bacterium]|nr:sirohydrochlorin cobaltochelatase [Lachnospiraceae bacterium]